MEINKVTKFRKQAMQIVIANCSGILGRSFDARPGELSRDLKDATHEVEAWLIKEDSRGK